MISVVVIVKRELCKHVSDIAGMTCYSSVTIFYLSVPPPLSLSLFYSDVSDQSTILLVDSSDLETGPLPTSTLPLVHRSSTGTPDADLSSDDEREDLNVSLQNPMYVCLKVTHTIYSIYIIILLFNFSSSLPQAHSNAPGVENPSPAVYLNGPTNNTHMNETDGLSTTQTRDVDVIPPPPLSPINPIDELVTVSDLQKEISFLKRKHQLEIQELHTELTLARLSAAQGYCLKEERIENRHYIIITFVCVYYFYYYL